MKILISFWLFALIGAEAWADNYHGAILPPASQDTYITNYYGVASAISAAQCHFDGGSFDLQLCGGVGFSGGSEAYTFGAGQKFGDFLVNFTETIERGKSSRGIGVNWKVKIK